MQGFERLSPNCFEVVADAHVHLWWGLNIELALGAVLRVCSRIWLIKLGRQNT